MRKILVIILLDIFCRSVFAQIEVHRGGNAYSFGLNFFPTLYFEKYNDGYALRYQPFGYNFGYCFRNYESRLFVRTAVNLDYLPRSRHQSFGEFDLALEAGIGYQLLDPEREWVVDIAACVFPAGQFYQTGFPSVNKPLYSLSAGPTLLAGHRFGSQWLWFTEINISGGYYWYDKRYEPNRQNFETIFYRIFGIGLRYEMNTVIHN